ncbi:myeloid-associated differentiation marker-like protein 2 [Puntigrus tetrazona]|uniref:myeloid-associated differentiation marker-like protein 2 n=1 Tax=Puntigrus tetrazona TaxID=1606681 RepID=UPI001C88F8A3|nr:myeloid-associated differentiation marker-like protein 2 [Puntigrus tetrazona]XP_043107490.1 myeloid-associated differentiation marker-like protein 2 [Puntigrus tetrazona]XP_043107491.1 myeloid-associated differentiation marker-like protein 2 [Puntigrus tetrazona]XP_043107492.1 myeloid-associated differentiation marker-like protein 2 [Puntigrus tetrazona]
MIVSQTLQNRVRNTPCTPEEEPQTSRTQHQPPAAGSIDLQRHETHSRLALLSRGPRPLTPSVGLIMSASAGHLNTSAVFSPVGVARVCQLTLGCAVVSLVVHGAGYSAPYGLFCMSAWTSCFAVSVVILVLDVTRLQASLPLSWENLTVALASLATLLSLTASVAYPVFFVRADDCPYNDCEVRNLRIAVSVCSGAACVSYGAEVFLSRAGPGRRGSYMATAPGVLKVAQIFVGCLIFALLAAGTDFSRQAATLYCVAVFGACLAGSVLLVALVVSGRSAALRIARMSFERLAVIQTFVAVLLYVSSSVLWPVFCFDRKYGAPLRPQGCPRGKCSWDVKLAVAAMSFLNLTLYIADLVCSHRSRPAEQRSRF